MVVVAVNERFQQRSWQNGHVHPRHEPTAGDFPERRLWKLLAPEDLPARDGPPIGPEEPGEFRDAAWRRALPHGGDENDDGAQVNLPAQKSHRRRRDSLAAPLAFTAEAETTLVGIGQRIDAARLSRVVGAGE